jgi:hypothetical protein
MNGQEPTFIRRLRAEIDVEVLQLQAVATGEADIKVVNAEYRERRQRIRRDLHRLGLSDPNRWADLWLWYGHYKDDPDLATYQSRREFVLRLYEPILEVLDHLQDRQLGTGLGPPETGWAIVDDQTKELRERFATAQTVEDYKDIGLRCREILISIGQSAYDVSRHVPEDQAPLKKGDAKGRLRQIVQAELPREENEAVRPLLRSLIEACWDASVDLLHDRKARLIQASLVANSVLIVASVLRDLVPEADSASDVDLEDERVQTNVGAIGDPDVLEADDYEPSGEYLAYLSYLAAREGWHEANGGLELRPPAHA